MEYYEEIADVRQENHGDDGGESSAESFYGILNK